MIISSSIDTYTYILSFFSFHLLLPCRCIEAALKSRGIDDNKSFNYGVSFAIDATKLVKNIEVHTGMRKILGGAYPNHLVDCSDMSSDDLQKTLDQSSGAKLKLTKAKEGKVAIISFQCTPTGVPPTVKMADRPQSTNESSCFTQAMDQAMKVVVARRSNLSFLNFTVDGVAVESDDVRRGFCDFLSGKENHTGSTDTNHNIKNWRYQIIGGSGVPSIGKLAVDSDLLRLASVSEDLIRPKDFASDLLVLKLVSYETLHKLQVFLETQADPSDDGGA